MKLVSGVGCTCPEFLPDHLAGLTLPGRFPDVPESYLADIQRDATG